MYIPPHFAVLEKEALYRLIEAHPLGILVTKSNGVLDANHIPFELDRRRMARASSTAMSRERTQCGRNCVTATR